MSTLPSQYDVRPLDESDSDAMRQLFGEVFGHAMSAPFRNWKYRAGASCALGVFSAGELVAHYGGIGAEISFRGQPATAVQIVDVMVKPAARKAIRKHSPFFLAGSAFLDHYIGFDKPWLLGYGFPSDRHMALAAHLRLYAPVGRMWELRWALGAADAKGPGLLEKLLPLDGAGLARHGAAIDALWQALQQDFREGIVVKKDAAHIARRYLQHPEKKYLVYLLAHRLTRTPQGLMVLKQDAQKMLLMDYVGPLRNLPAVLRLAKYQARRQGCSELGTWCGEKFLGCFGAAAGAATDAPTFGAVVAKALPITTPANIWTAGPTPEELQNRWWLMPGDTDFL
jgi:hypothetical protein